MWGTKNYQQLKLLFRSGNILFRLSQVIRIWSTQKLPNVSIPDNLDGHYSLPILTMFCLIVQVLRTLKQIQSTLPYHVPTDCEQTICTSTSSSQAQHTSLASGHPGTLPAIFFTNLPKSEGKTTLLVGIDQFSHAVKLIPLHHLPLAFETAEQQSSGPMVSQLVLNSYGMEKYYGKVGNPVSLTSGHHLQANGQVELMHQEIGRYQRTYQNYWVHFVPWV